MTLSLTEIKGYNLKLYQKKKGYRFSIDSFLLAWYVSKQRFENAFEIGAGSGIVSLLADRMTKGKKHFELIEIQKDLFEICKKNIEINFPLKSEFEVRNEDARFVLPSKKPQIVYGNPPFTDFRKGRVSPYFEKAVARHTYFLTLEDILRWHSEICEIDTPLILIDNAKNLEKYKTEFEKEGFYINEIIYISPFEKSEFNLFMIKGSRVKGNFTRDSLYIFENKGEYSYKVKQILGLI